MTPATAESFRQGVPVCLAAAGSYAGLALLRSPRLRLPCRFIGWGMAPVFIVCALAVIFLGEVGPGDVASLFILLPLFLSMYPPWVGQALRILFPLAGVGALLAMSGFVLLGLRIRSLAARERDLKALAAGMRAELERQDRGSAVPR